MLGKVPLCLPISDKFPFAPEEKDLVYMSCLNQIISHTLSFYTQDVPFFRLSMFTACMIHSVMRDMCCK